MTGFARRLALAVTHEGETRRLLEERGWECEPFGQALLGERMRALLRRTRSAIRWMPDIIACRDSVVILVDAKEAQRLDTPNWTIEAAAFDAGTAFQATFGHPLLYVWHDFTANLHDELVFANSDPWGGLTRGSGTPYWLVRKTTTRPLDDVLAETLTT